MSEVVEIDLASARRLTERIRLMALTVGENIDKLKALVTEARESEIHHTLGYPSWTAYLSEVLGETPMRLERDVRQELVAELSSQGMSTRAIAPIVGVNAETVRRDISGAANVAPESEPDTGHWSPDSGFDANPFTGEVFEPKTVTETHAVKTVTGLDGKNYKTPEARTERRRSLIDDAYTANTKLWEAIERIRTIASDDRFNRNKADIQAALQPSVDLALEVLNDLNPTNESE